jgi:hypothetical protein
MSPAPKPGPPTAAAVAAPKASAAAFDDELDALLGLGPSVGAGARQLPKQVGGLIGPVQLVRWIQVVSTVTQGQESWQGTPGISASALYFVAFVVSSA